MMRGTRVAPVGQVVGLFCVPGFGREPVAFEAIADKQFALNVCSSPSIAALKIGWISSETKLSLWIVFQWSIYLV